MGRIKLLVITLLMLTGFSVAGLKASTQTVAVAASPNCSIDAGFYAKSGDATVDPKFKITSNAKSIDPNFYVGKCNK